MTNIVTITICILTQFDLLILLESLHPLEDGRVGVVPGGVQPVVDREAEVVVVELHQRARQVRGLAQLGRELVRLEGLRGLRLGRTDIGEPMCSRHRRNDAPHERTLVGTL